MVLGDESDKYSNKNTKMDHQSPNSNQCTSDYKLGFMNQSPLNMET